MSERDDEDARFVWQDCDDDAVDLEAWEDAAKAGPDPTDEVLNETRRFVRRYVILTDAQADAIALWVAHTHAFEAADTTPYLAITSATKRSGKTRLLEVLELLCPRARLTSNVSDAAFYRLIHQAKPTLLIDEYDTIFQRGGDREGLRGLLNAGFRRGGTTLRVGGPQRSEVEEFDGYCAKALAGIGPLPDTVADRSIVIRLDRRTKSEPTERFRHRHVVGAAADLKKRLETWSTPNVPHLREAEPALPDELDDRAQDIWEPLLAIAELAGETWKRRGYNAAVALSGPGAREEDTEHMLLLEAVYRSFAARSGPHVTTADLVYDLSRDPSGLYSGWWNSYDHEPARGVAQRLARQLATFGIRPISLWLGRQTLKGYKRADLEPHFERYLRQEPAGPPDPPGGAPEAAPGLTPPSAPAGMDTDPGSATPALDTGSDGLTALPETTSAQPPAADPDELRYS